MNIKGILWHSTGCNNSTLRRYVQPSANDPKYNELMQLIGKNAYNNDWNDPNLKVCVNAFIGKLADNSVTTLQTLPWNWTPYGCGTGKYGSCNNGWIQFEICEDDLTNKTYFNAVYKEACELTAYLCKLYNIDPYGTVEYNGVQVPTILCHGDANSLGVGSAHVDVNHWFPKYGKSMSDVRKDVAKLLASTAPAIKPMLYRVRKTWQDSASQVGAFTNLENAITCAKENGSSYYVFDEAGKIIYPEVKKPTIVANSFVEGETVKLTEDAKYYNGSTIPSWVFANTLYVRGTDSRGVMISTQKEGAITGIVSERYLTKESSKQQTTTTTETKTELKVGDIITLDPEAKYANGVQVPSWVLQQTLYCRQIQEHAIIFSTQKTGPITGAIEKKYVKAYKEAGYKVEITASLLNVRNACGIFGKIVAQLRKGSTQVISEVKNGWGKIDNLGWISLCYTKKV